VNLGTLTFQENNDYLASIQINEQLSSESRTVIMLAALVLLKSILLNSVAASKRNQLESSTMVDFGRFRPVA
jgi:hypothetical protein